MRCVFVGKDKMGQAGSPQGSSSVFSCPTGKRSRKKKKKKGRRNGRSSNRLGEEGSRWSTQSGVVLLEKVASALGWGLKVVMCGVEFWRRQGPPGRGKPTYLELPEVPVPVLGSRTSLACRRKFLGPRVRATAELEQDGWSVCRKQRSLPPGARNEVSVGNDHKQKKGGRDNDGSNEKRESFACMPIIEIDAGRASDRGKRLEGEKSECQRTWTWEEESKMRSTGPQAAAADV